MSLRLHHYLYILPLFLFLGMGSAGISAWLDNNEIRKGLEDEAAVHAIVAAQWPSELAPPEGAVLPQPSDPGARLAELHRSLWIRTIIWAATALIIGLAVAEVLTQVSLRELRLLQRSATALMAGSFDHEHTAGLIREYAELDSTMGTLARVLHDNSRKKRAQMLKHDVSG